MRLLLTFFLSLLLTTFGQAQERVRNVRLRVADSSQLEIRYDLISVRPGDSIYLNVISRLRGPLRILPEFVRGDIGKQITAGPDRRIVWSALANGYSLNEEVRATVLVKAGGTPASPESSQPAEPIATAPTTDRSTATATKRPKQVNPVESVPAEPRPNPTDVSAPVVNPPSRSSRPSESVAQPGEARPGEAQPKPDNVLPPQPAVLTPDRDRSSEVASQKKRYAGPAWGLLSAVAPGVGNIFVQTPKPKIGLRPLLAVGAYGLLVYGLRERQQSRDVYAVYEQQKNAETGEPYYQVANNHYQRYYLATRGAIVVAAADVILTFFKGIRNGKEAAANQPLSSVTLRPGLQAGQPTAVFRYSF